MLAIAGVLILLAVVQLLLAARHDRAVTAAGPIEELAIYERRLEEKQRLVDELENELEKRRQAMAVVADLQAEVDGLRRQKEELLAEWESLRERRDEVAAVRQETEAAVIERQQLESEIAPLRAEYLAIKERLEKAEELLGRTEALKREYEEISEQVNELRERKRELEEAKERISGLESRAQELETTISRLEGRMASEESELANLQTRVASEREALAHAQTEHGRLGADLAAQGQEVRRITGEIETLEGTRSTLDARLAYLKGEIARSEGRSVDGETGDADPLRELKETPPVVVAMRTWDPAPRENEADAIMRVERRLRAKGLDYPARTLRAFHTAMKVNETTQMAVLAGISGTGKSQLPRQYAAGMGIGFLQVPVQPRWDSPQDLMGFYNYIEGKFRPTDMARALWAVDELHNDQADRDRMMMILLDEMNLARVEYYFSDFLSRLESRPRPSDVGDANERKDAEIELEIPNMQMPPRIFPGYNLLFAGTMNEDESTQSLSDKVVDRANILRFAAPKKIKEGHAEGDVEPTKALSRETWTRWGHSSAHVDGDARVTARVEQMVDLMREFQRPFGHRLGRAIMAYAANYPEVEGGRGVDDALADQVEMRLLPKLRGVEVDMAAPQFSNLMTFVDRDLGDAPLAEAIDESVRLSEATGQFVWRGVSR
ncbi:chromosome segregation ATPase-like protein [Tropicimonas sp. IMCC34011]|uniref:chromosome segregation ATPase-like protein n=1 Tax=Tropicimonas sp. IMCC34011 TaxID=2248759 RepID=UPI001E49DE0B|nr:chromosome segregation ATPase-like protein [Tropicimonas sp. IMCC34011]